MIRLSSILMQLMPLRKKAHDSKDGQIVRTSTKGLLFGHQPKDQKRDLYGRRDLQDHAVEPPSFLRCCRDQRRLSNRWFLRCLN